MGLSNICNIGLVQRFTITPRCWFSLFILSMIVHLDVGDDNDNVKLSDIGYDTHAAFHNHKRDRPKRF